MRIIKKTITELVNFLGYDLIKTNRYPEYEYRRKLIFEKNIPKESPVIFDVGAHHGESIKEFRLLFPTCKIYSFEPDPNSFSILYKQYGDTQNIFIENYGITSDKNKGVGAFFIQSESKLNSLSPVNNNSNTFSDCNYKRAKLGKRSLIANYKKVEVNLLTLDDYVKEKGVNKIDLLKLDVQSHEPEVLSGAGHSLSITSAVYIEITFFDLYESRCSLFYDIEQYLIPHKFELFAMPRVAWDSITGKINFVEALYIKRS